MSINQSSNLEVLYLFCYVRKMQIEKEGEMYIYIWSTNFKNKVFQEFFF